MMGSKVLEGFGGLKLAISTVRDGDMALRAALEKNDRVMIERVKANRSRFLSKAGIKLDDCISARLDGHTDKVVVVSVSDCGQGMTWYDERSVRDGLITKDMGVGLFMVSADCPIGVFYDPIEQVLGMAHFSWITTDKRIPEKMVRVMTDLAGSRPGDVRVYVGPGIKKESYLFANPEQKRMPAWRKHIEDLANGETAIDLNSYQREQLILAGVKEGNIEFSKVDTASDGDYFSHYRAVRTGEPEGRFATVAVMTN